MSAIPTMLGATDETYGVQLWEGRIRGLASHLRIIRDHLPDDAHWLRKQTEAGIREANRYLADLTPVAASPTAPLSDGSTHVAFDARDGEGLAHLRSTAMMGAK